MKKNLLIKNNGSYCINFALVDSAETHINNDSYKVLLYSNICEAPIFILYYKEKQAMNRAYRNILSIIESYKPGKVIQVNFGKE